MNKIGFKNFRRFQDFPLLEYRGITFLVGKNNAGKSTVVKALLLINDFLKSGYTDVFHFGETMLEEANIVTFGRAKNYFAKDDVIQFDFHLEEFSIQIKVTGLPDATIADVHSFLIKDQQSLFEIVLEPPIHTLTLYSFSKSEGKFLKETEDAIEKSELQLNALKDDFKKGKPNPITDEYIKSLDKEEITKYVDQISEVTKLDANIKRLKNTLSQNANNTVVFSLHSHYDNVKPLNEVIEEFFMELSVKHDVQFNEVQKGKKQTKEFQNLRAFKEEKFTIEKRFEEFLNLIERNEVVYLGASSIKQSALFLIRDKKNALAQAIHDFFQLKITPGEPAYEFVKYWLKQFEVGDSFEIKMHSGEAYEVFIHSNDARIPLADKGMGSVQSALLIFRLASILQKGLKDKKLYTILIEEPELNLHPALQSKLADLFLEVHQKFGMNFIIETHSEYAIRRSQVLVAEKEFEVAPNENPFCVYYFPKDPSEHPYQLGYNRDGSFDKNFGEGFFDEASKRTLDLLRIKREKKS